MTGETEPTNRQDEREIDIRLVVAIAAVSVVCVVVLTLYATGVI